MARDNRAHSDVLNPQDDPRDVRMGARRHGRGPSLIWWAAGIVFVILIVWAVWEAVDEDTTAGGQVGVIIGDIAGNPEAHLGKAVTLSGNVGKVYTARSFTVAEDREILIVASPNTELDTRPITERAVVQVTGTVVRFAAEDVSWQTGWQIDSKLHADWAGRPAIVATEVKYLGRKRPPEDLAPPAGGGGAGREGVSLKLVLGDPARFTATG